MTEIVTIQPAAFPDNIWPVEGGEAHVGTKLPYPLHVRPDGSIENQDLWRGDPARVVGFTRRPEERVLALIWADVTDPDQLVGMYLVTANSTGGYATHSTAIESVQLTQVP